MEKLIELLNEYNDNKEGVRIGFITTIQIDGVSTSYELSKSDLLRWEDKIISKKFGFIKWLVENDKIGFEKCGFNIKNYLSYNKWYDKGIVLAENYDNDTFVVREFYSPYEQLLMLLSISDTPIEDLISYLK